MGVLSVRWKIFPSPSDVGQPLLLPRFPQPRFGRDSVSVFECFGAL